MLHLRQHDRERAVFFGRPLKGYNARLPHLTSLGIEERVPCTDAFTLPSLATAESFPSLVILQHQSASEDHPARRREDAHRPYADLPERA